MSNFVLKFMEPMADRPTLGPRLFMTSTGFEAKLLNGDVIRCEELAVFLYVIFPISGVRERTDCSGSTSGTVASRVFRPARGGGAAVISFAC